MKSVIALCTTALLAIASTAHASPATDIELVRGIFSANFPDGVKTVEESTDEETDPWKITSLKFEYGGKSYSLSLSYTEGMEYLDMKAVYQNRIYTVVDEGVSPDAESPCGGIDATPDIFSIGDQTFSNSSVAEVKKECEMFPGEKKIYLPPKTEKALSNQYKDALLALVKYYSSNKVSKN